MKRPTIRERFGKFLVRTGFWMSRSQIEMDDDPEPVEIPLPPVKLSPEAQRMVNEIRDTPPPKPEVREPLPAGSAQARIEAARRRLGGP